MPPIKIGTRASQLALTQAEMVRDALLLHHGDAGMRVDIVPMTTTGDRITGKPLADAGGKGLFTKEIEEALLAGEVDLAVHSMKDMPTELPPGLAIACMLPREDPLDALISPKAMTLQTLPQGATIGTSSLRRAAQMLKHRPDLKVVNFRGNVHTRLQKLREGRVDATLLAVAGLKRLGMEKVISAVLPPDVMLPAVAQGAIGIEIREKDQTMRERLRPLSHMPTEICVNTEREALRVLDGNCRTPIAAYAEIHDASLRIRALVAATDGNTVFRTEMTGAVDDALALGREAGNRLLHEAGEGFLIGIRS